MSKMGGSYQEKYTQYSIDLQLSCDFVGSSYDCLFIN